MPPELWHFLVVAKMARVAWPLLQQANGQVSTPADDGHLLALINVNRKWQGDGGGHSGVGIGARKRANYVHENGRFSSCYGILTFSWSQSPKMDPHGLTPAIELAQV